MRIARPFLAGILIVSTGCFTTRIQTPARSDGVEREGHQAFTLGGLAPLSSADGSECPAGVARAETSFGPLDVLVWLGAAAGGAVLGATACSNATDRGFACANLGASLGPFLFATRTVKYECARPRPEARESRVPRIVPPDEERGEPEPERLDRSLLKRDTPSAVLFYKGGKALLEAGKFDDAISAFARCAQADPELPACHLGLYRAHRDAGRPEDARKECQAFIGLAREADAPFVSECVKYLAPPAADQDAGMPDAGS